MLVEMHMLKSFPPTNLNRDESGSPKSCFFGGCQRGRISSQSLKHSWREDSEFSLLPLGTRTRFLPDVVGDRLKAEGFSDKQIDAIKPILAAFGKKEEKGTQEGSGDTQGEDNAVKEGEKKEVGIKQIMFFSADDLDEIVKAAMAVIRKEETPENIKKVKVAQLQEELKTKVRKATVDMAFFGRMITDVAFKDVEASLQVAHALSTHAVNMESDFFTAVDDLRAKYSEDHGSAMMGDTDFNSCCYYFYASLDTDQLRQNLNGAPDVRELMRKALRGLASAMIFTNPSGKQNSFAGHSLPGVVCFQRKERKIPISLANAFEEPVRSRGGYMRPSADALVRHMDACDASFGIPVAQRLWFAPGIEAAPALGERVATIPQLLDTIGQWAEKG